jgi:hypothetical protein
MHVLTCRDEIRTKNVLCGMYRLRLQPKAFSTTRRWLELLASLR